MKILLVISNRPQGLKKVMDYEDFNDIRFITFIESIYATALTCAKSGYDYFITGGAVGVDLDFAEAVIFTRETFIFASKINLEIAIPCNNQDGKWRECDRQRYREVLNESNYNTQISEIYSPSCMFNRNKYMVDKADKIIAYWNGEKKGGTWNTIQYAIKIGKPLEIIDLRKQ